LPPIVLARQATGRTSTHVPYEAHLRKSDGTELEVLVSRDLAVTAVNTMQH
jgi:hypothetical protein